MTFPRWLRNPFGWLAGFLVAVLAIPLALFFSWRSDRWNQLERGSELLETPLGVVEVARSGTGPAVLVIHGSPGGYDQGMALAAPLIEAGFSVIAPSRPGYLRTPLAGGVLVSQQADLLAALMEQLDIPAFAVLAFGQGAPVALALAEKHPDRVRRLSLWSPVLKSRSWPAILEQNRLPGWAINQAFTGDMGAWLFAEQARWQPARALERAFALTTTLKPFDQFVEAGELLQKDGAAETFRALVRSVTPVSRREVGIRNDTVLSLVYPKVEFARLTMPLQIVQGRADAFADSPETQALIGQAPRAGLIELDRTGYLVPLGPESAKALKQVIEFLRTDP